MPGPPRRRGTANRDVVYGTNPVREALRGRRAVLEVLATERVAGSDWLRSAPAVRVASVAAVAELAGSADHQGVAATVAPFAYAEADALLAAPQPLLLILDGVTDPHNLGAIARVVEGAGATGLILPRHGAVAVTPAVCKASAGAIEHVSVAIVANLAVWIRDARRADLWSYTAATDGEALHTDVDLTGGVAIVIGAEGRGVRPLVRTACDGSLRLPQRGLTASLNASVAAGVLLYEAVRQRTIT